MTNLKERIRRVLPFLYFSSLFIIAGIKENFALYFYLGLATLIASLIVAFAED